MVGRGTSGRSVRCAQMHLLATGDPRRRAPNGYFGEVHVGAAVDQNVERGPGARRAAAPREKRVARSEGEMRAHGLFDGSQTGFTCVRKSYSAAGCSGSG